MTLQEMIEKRKKLWNDMKGVLDKAKAEGRSMTGEELTKYNAMEKDLDDLEGTIKAEERAQDLEKRFAEPARPNPAIQMIGGEGGEGRALGKDSEEYRQMFRKVVAGRNDIEQLRSMHIHTDSDAGVALVPTNLAKMMIDNTANFNVMRGLATVMTLGANTEIPFVASHGSASWIDEEGDFAESDDKVDKKIIKAYKVGTLMKISNELIKDNIFNLENYTSQEFGRRVGEKEETAFVAGDGTGKPRGFMLDATLGTTSAAGTALVLDEVIDLYHAVERQYRKVGTWLMNDSTIKAVRKIKDKNDQYIWQPGATAGAPDTLFGRPLETSNDMDEIGAGKKVMAFGDFKQYYIVDREDIYFQILKEVYATKGQVGFLAYKRVDGRLMDNNAIKYLQMHA